MEGSGLWRALRGMGAPRSFSTGEYLVRAGTGPGSVVALLSGVCKVTTGTGDGRDTVVAVRGPGEVVGEVAAFTGTGRSASVVALTAVEAVEVPLSGFEAWLDREPGAARLAAEVLADRLAEATLRNAGLHQPVVVRLADRVLALAERFGAGERSDRWEVPLTHDDYAAWIGATRSVTTRAFSELRAEGLVALGRGWIQVLDVPGLERVCRRGRLARRPG